MQDQLRLKKKNSFVTTLCIIYYKACKLCAFSAYEMGFGIFGVAIVTSFPVYCMLLTDRISILAGGNNYIWYLIQFHNLIKNIFLIIWIFP